MRNLDEIEFDLRGLLNSVEDVQREMVHDHACLAEGELASAFSNIAQALKKVQAAKGDG